MRVQVSRYRPRHIIKNWNRRKQQLEKMLYYADKYEERDIVKQMYKEFIQKTDQVAMDRLIKAKERKIKPVVNYLHEFRKWLFNRYPEAFFPELNANGLFGRKPRKKA